MAMHPRCWASVLDDCAGHLTAEHMLSVAAMQTPNPLASRREKERHIVAMERGRNPYRKVERVLPYGSYCEHMLCEAHNRGSSELDAEGGRLSDALRGYVEALYRRAGTAFSHKAAAFPPLDVRAIDGRLVYRWLLKVGVNLAVHMRDGLPIGGIDADADRPRQEIVETVYGRRPVDASAPMWLVTKPGGPKGGRFEPGDSFSFAFWERTGEYIDGFTATIFGLHFVVSFSETVPPWSRVGRDLNLRRFSSGRPFRGLSLPELAVAVRFDWPGSVEPAVVGHHDRWGRALSSLEQVTSEPRSEMPESSLPTVSKDRAVTRGKFLPRTTATTEHPRN